MVLFWFKLHWILFSLIQLTALVQIMAWICNIFKITTTSPGGRGVCDKLIMIAFDWKLIFVIMLNLSSLMTPEVVLLTTNCATSHNKVGIIMILFCFLCFIGFKLWYDFVTPINITKSWIVKERWQLLELIIQTIHTNHWSKQFDQYPIRIMSLCELRIRLFNKKRPVSSWSLINIIFTTQTAPLI